MTDIFSIDTTNLMSSFQSTNQQQAVDGNKVIHINLSDKFAAALQGSPQDGAWQGIDIRCSQQDENRSQQGSYAPFRPPSRMRLEQEARGTQLRITASSNLKSLKT
ncbi:hypothetical protein OS493_029956 [Desmophyllum pertusum]|uniref:Uncharacterized protein n=1 Tax=Desmophyllum pertusum TaxID=174260 RepID=A0A9W9ZXD5_9CNID|nr:hypothetical protein OS493_029956 [Desmophyllum pertusum]